MKKWLNDAFGFSKAEFNGLLGLLGLIVLIGTVPYGYNLVKTGDTIDAKSTEVVKMLFLSEKDGIAHNKILPGNAYLKRKPVLFYFDPNEIDADEWQILGLSERQSASILKYRAKGGQFRKPEDLKKMYVISHELYERLVPYVRINDQSELTSGFENPIIKEKDQDHPLSVLRIIEINGADSTALEEIRGIGPAFALRIMKYRERIGGFYKKEQLMEVFGLDSTKYMEIKDQFIVDVSKIKKINVNEAMPEDFKNHPYIRYKQVNALIQYRKQHGNYINIAELNNVVILSPEVLKRLAPYLTF
ncbi:ComEA family DNA-binding protein [Pedobacter metabolipauper]|uniref:DNA uptake protein ComE-like DNA-binding protein n=1 Tax=Pedobacter metabolipauper TaxID=425513 RepID=A0A4R6SSS2_9SPHI|nr:helix-hairpin-helix domain-containing protein [Pedobacter metabolipauper]TDQ07445.1 DNA uptake protein ComE-like DNA-binding protein [Pedobacter metabolipauper]